MEEPTARVVPGFELIGEDSNIFSILGRFQRQARRADWGADEIGTVRTYIMSLENYDLALAHMTKYVDWGEDDEEHGYDDDVMFGS